MERLRFYKDGLPPVLLSGKNDVVVLDNYIIGSQNDPHWKLYSKKDYLTARNLYPEGWAFTNYQSFDANHYIYYMTESAGPTGVYSRLLRNHFEIIHRRRQQANRDAQMKTMQERTEKVNQLIRLLNEQIQLLNEFKYELKKLKSNRDRATRAATRSSTTPRDMVEAKYDSANPMYLNTAISIITIESNISSLKKELKTYMD